jgi:hypothetical protein
VVLFAVMVGATWLMNRAADRMVGDKHRALETIVDAGEVPAKWSERFKARVARLQARGDFEGVLEIQTEAKLSYLDRLGRLTEYAEETPLVEDEETREVLLSQLALVRQVWERRAADEF